MSEENNTGSAGTEESGNSNQQESQGFVSKKAYEEVTRDMHKNKQKAKELEAAYNELQSQLKAQEEAKMQEQERWKELFQQRDSELEEARKEVRERDERFNRSIKISALKNEIGANIKDEYLRFANLDDIQMVEGVVDKESLREVANSFRKEHGQLIPQTENVNITGQAPNSSSVHTVKDFSKMNSTDLIQEYAKLKSQT